MAGNVHTGALAGLAAIFVPSDPPREGRIAFWDPSGGDLPLGVGEHATLELALRDDRQEPGHGEPGDGERGASERGGAQRGGVGGRGGERGDRVGGTAERDGSERGDGPRGGGGLVTRVVRVVEVPVDQAVAVLGRARTTPGAHPAAAFWGAAALIALQLVARGRLLPGVSPGGHDAWRVGPLDAADVDRVLALAESIPFEARCLPLSQPELRVPVGEELVRQFLDAVADGMPRSPRCGEGARHHPLRGQGASPGAAVALLGRRGVGRPRHRRTDLPPHRAARVARLPRRGAAAQPAGPHPRARRFRRLGGGCQRFRSPCPHRRHAGDPARGPRLVSAVPAARLRSTGSARLADEEVAGLLATGAQRLAAAGVELHWPRNLGRELTARAAITSTDGPPSDMPSFFGGTSTMDFSWQVALGNDPLTEAELDQLAEATRPVVRLRDQWMLVDPELARKARERILKPVTAIDALSAALTGTTEVDGRQIAVTPNALARRAASQDRRPRAFAGSDRSAHRTAGNPPRLPAARPALACPHDGSRPRRLPRRRHGSRQDDHPDLPAPAPPAHRRNRRADPRGLPGLAARQLGTRGPALRPRHAGTAVPRRRSLTRRRRQRIRVDDVRDPAARCRPAGRSSLGSTRRRRGPARQEPNLRYCEGAAHCARPGPSRPHRYSGREQPLRAVGDPRLDDPRTARPPQHLPHPMGDTDRG